MDIRDVFGAPPPAAWEGRLPWDDPAFSRRMLSEHLSQAHDLASRRFAVVDGHVAWLHRLAGGPGRVLDLACGPGLYSSRLARLGHRCVGVDFAPAAIEFARDEAARLGLDCEYRLADLTEGFDDGPFDLVLFLYGDLDTIPPDRAAAVLAAMVAALRPGGHAVIEAHTVETVRRLGGAPRSWRAVPGGVFSDHPHLLLEEASWDEADSIAVSRVWVVEAAGVTRHSVTTQAREYERLLASLVPPPSVTRYPGGIAPWVDAEFDVVVVRRD